MSLLNLYSVEIIEDGISQFEKADLPTQVKVTAIKKLEDKSESFYNNKEQLDEFKISKETYENMIHLQKQELLNKTAIESSIKPNVEEQIKIKVKTEIAAIEKQVNTIQNEIQKSADFYTAKAMSKAFFIGLIIACLFSFSLILLRNRETKQIGY